MMSFIIYTYVAMVLSYMLCHQMITNPT